MDDHHLSNSNNGNIITAEIDAIIYSPAKSSMSSGKVKNNFWKVELIAKHQKYIDPIMFWNAAKNQTESSELNNVMYFNSLDDAESFAKKRGFRYFVKHSSVDDGISKFSYLDNFKKS